MRAFLVDIFHGLYQGKSVIFAAGRLENGETFGFLDDQITPCFYLRASDLSMATAYLKRHRASHHSTAAKTMDGEPVCLVSLATLMDLRLLEKELAGKGIRTYEADLDYAMMYRITRRINAVVNIEGDFRPSPCVDRFYRNPQLSPAVGAPDLTVLALDIETDADASTLLGFSLVSWQLQGDTKVEEVHLIGADRSDDPAGMFAHGSERDLLQAFRERLIAIDPDIVTGWNVIDFDLTVLARLFKLHGLPFNLGRTKDVSFARLSPFYGKGKMILRGRQVLDALSLVRYSLHNFEDLRLNTVAQELLQRGKTLAIEEWQDTAATILEAFQSDRQAFCEYVLEDSRLVRDILRQQNLLELTLTRSLLTNLPLEKAWGSVVAFETLYIGEMRKRSMVAPTRGIDSTDSWGGSGGLILDPVVGLHEHVLVFDFKSLYPSVMRTFNIDPIAFIEGQALPAGQGIVAPNGAVFAREPAILPEILHGFFNHRAEAKKLGHEAESYCYKIVMNSFYGVLATDSCRFADIRLADAITGFGQKLLVWMKKYWQGQGFKVLYGDTDSLFVAVPTLAGMPLPDVLQMGHRLSVEANQALAQALSEEYQVESHMELEFEEYYRYLFLPSDRQGDGSRAKNYAGLQLNRLGEKLVIKGLEAVRSDWTPLAKNLQKDLLLMLFHQKPADAMVSAIKGLVKSMLAGHLEADLIYRKRIRKPLEAYTKTTPPHIKAARLLPRPVRVVRYVMTVQGPQPLGFVNSAVDYDHYIQKQILPIVEGLAPFAGFAADEACNPWTGFHFEEELILAKKPHPPTLMQQ